MAAIEPLRCPFYWLFSTNFAIYDQSEGAASHNDAVEERNRRTGYGGDRVVAEVKPCPFCGEVGVVYVLVEGNKWGAAVCGFCEAQGPTVRTGYDDSDDAPWHADALAEWNKRADDGGD